MKKISEIAQLFRVSEQTAKSWVLTGKLNAFHVAGTYRVTQEHLDTFIAANEVSRSVSA